MIYGQQWSSKTLCACLQEQHGHDVPLPLLKRWQSLSRQNLKANRCLNNSSNSPTPTEFGEFLHPTGDGTPRTLVISGVAVSQVLGGFQEGRHRMYFRWRLNGQDYHAAGAFANLWSFGLIRRALSWSTATLSLPECQEIQAASGITSNSSGVAQRDKHRDILVTTLAPCVRNKVWNYDPEHFGS